MTNADRSLYRVQAKWVLSSSGMSLRISNVLNADWSESSTVASFDNASIVFSNDKSTRQEMMIWGAAAGILTITNRWLDQWDTINTVVANQLQWGAWTIIYVTKLAFNFAEIPSLDWDNVWMGDNTFIGNTVFMWSLEVPVYANNAARDAWIISPADWMIVYNIFVWLFQKHQWGTWVDDLNGSIGPNASTTVAGKVQEGTVADNIAHTEIWTTWAPLFMSPLNTVTVSEWAADEGKSILANSSWGIDPTIINNTTLPIQTILPNTFITWFAEEAITISHAISALPWRLQSDTATNMNTATWGTWWSWPTTQNLKTWYAFTIRAGESWVINSIDSTVQATKNTWTYWSDNTITISGTFNIYAASWTPWSTWLPTWSALYTSTTSTYVFISWQVFGTPTLFWMSKATFSWVSLAAWNYVMQFEWTVVWGGANNSASWIASFVWTATNALYQVNWVQTWTTASATNVMYFFTESNDSYVYEWHADSTYTNAFSGFATASASKWATVNYQNQWSASITCTVDTAYYLSDTPWSISTSPGTLPVLIWYGLKTNDLMIWVPFEKATSVITSSTPFYTGCNGIVTWYAKVVSGTAAGMKVELFSGDYADRVLTFISGNWLNTSATAWYTQISIPVRKGKYYNLTNTHSGSGTFTESFTFVPDYI